jgi:hypothetical protein
MSDTPIDPVGEPTSDDPLTEGPADGGADTEGPADGGADTDSHDGGADGGAGADPANAI